MAEDTQTPPPDSPPAQPPDPQAIIADLQAKIEAATGNAQKALDATKGALAAANPNLPTTVFEAPDLEALIANVEAHKATAAHVLETARAAPPPGAPPIPNPAATRTLQVPTNLRGITRIAFALNNPGPGMTE